MTILSKFFSLVERLILLTAYLDCSVDIENRLSLMLTLRSLNELSDLIFLLKLDVAIQKQGCVVLVIVTHCVKALALHIGSLLLRWRLNQLL